MPPKKAIAKGATTKAQSSQSQSQGQSINDVVDETENLTSDVPAMIATLTGHAMGDEIDQSNEHTEGEQDIVKHLDLLATLDPDDFVYDRLTKKFQVRRSLEYRTQDNTAPSPFLSWQPVKIGKQSNDKRLFIHSSNQIEYRNVPSRLP